MSALTETYALNNGNQIPKIGFGTWLLDEGMSATTLSLTRCSWAIATSIQPGPTTTRRQ
jgi:diketogulonate reductase-like aldo/keto reductase